MRYVILGHWVVPEGVLGVTMGAYSDPLGTFL
jgi:hypothetical protein